MIRADYEMYRNSVGITNAQMTKILNRTFPHYTRITASMVNQPEKYGVCLTPSAEDLLARTFGLGRGLAWVTYVKENIRARRDDHRKKGNRITVWLSDDTYFRLLSLKTANIYPTLQSFAEAAIVELIEKERMRKAEIIEAESGVLDGN